MSRPLIITDCDEVLMHMVVPFGAWLITSATTAGGVDILYAADKTKVQRGVGRSIGRRAGVGTTVGARLDLGRTWGV